MYDWDTAYVSPILHNPVYAGNLTVADKPTMYAVMANRAFKKMRLMIWFPKSKPQIGKTEYLKEAFNFGKSIYNE